VLRASAAIGLALALAACGGGSKAKSDGGADAAPEAPVEHATEASVDVPVETSVDAIDATEAHADAAEVHATDAADAPAPVSHAPAGSPCVAGATYGAPLPANATPVLVKDGFQFLEGPVWVATQSALFFSDFDTQATTAPGRQRKYTPADGNVVEWLFTTATNGLALETATTFLGASQQSQSLVRFDAATKAVTPVAGGDKYQGAPFNCLNDVVARADGNVYFTDPTYQRGGRAGQDGPGYYRLSPAGVVTRLGTGTQPNGISLSPDGRWLYVATAADAGGGVVRHAVLDDGSVGPGATWSALPSDGMAVDCAGNVYLVGGGAVTVLPPDGGAALGKLTGLPNTADAFVTNAAFGGADAKTLFITSSHALYKVALNVPGLPN
jgi:gluconolactonase